MVKYCEIIAIFGVSMKNRLLKNVSGVLFSAFLVFIFSCDNGFSSYSDSSAAVPKSKTHTVNGYISLSGALPDKVIPAASNNSADRSAVPTINTTDYHYFVEAVQTDGPGSYSTEDSSEFITATGGTVSFALHLTDGNWNVTCGVKNSDGETVLSQTLPQPITADETVADLHFIVRPEPRADGTVVPGDIELTASAASPITYATAYCDNAKWKEKTSATGVKALGPDYSLSVTGLESGAYDITFTFYDAQNVIRFQTNQTVNIIPGMKTNKWVSGSASDGAVITSTGFNVTTSLMNGFSRTIYYVGDAAGAASADGEGTAYKPFNSLAKAFTAITQTKNAEKDYTIHLTGTQTAATTMSSGRCFVVPDGIKSLTIVGDSGFSGEVPVATINGNNKGTVIEANSNLILKNVKVMGGKAEGSGSQGYGGGLYIASGKKVSLEKTLIGDAIATTGNAAATSSAGNYGNMAMRGGGIYNDGGELILKSGSYISHNFAIGGFSQGGGGGIYVAGAGSVKINDGAKIILNNGDGRGGGIFVSGTGSVSMSGGNIDYNQIKYNGGGVYCEIENANVNAFEMTGGSISYNKSPNSTGMGEGGGGFYLQKGIFSISGNSLISGNYAKKRGGGICIETDGTVDMSAGVISENWSDGDINGSGSDAAAARSVVNGGAIHNSGILKISGTAYIPYGVTNSSGVLVKGENKNDIFLTSDTKCVTVTGDVSLPAGKSGANATITPCHWTRNIEVLKAGSNIITDAVTSHFKITDGDFKINKNAENTAGKLAAPIYVAGEGFRLCEKTGETGASAAGTKANPYATLGQALDVISGGGAEVIYIDGKIIGGNEIPSTFNTATCSELTIKGVSDATHPAFVTVDGKSEPANSLNGGGTERALNIETLVPVILEDIKVTNGSISSGNGSGIYIGGTYNSSSSSITAKANLTLKNVLISGNKITGSTTNANGIGLYAWCADVTMEGGSIIGHDGTNSKDIHGGGVGLGHSKFTMNGGKISGNKVKNYGANVYMNNPDSEFILNDGEISDGLTESSVCDANSGGVWIDGSSTFTMKGGAIKNNTAKFTGSATSSYKAQGGGVYISNGTFDMQGGEMSGNKAEGTGHCGGAVIVYGGSNKSFKMSGDAKIIYGGSSGNNDVYLGYNATNPGKITVSDTLSGTGTVATITPEKWKRGTVVLNATSSGLMTNSVSRFAMADSEFTVNEKSLTGTAVISADIIVGANSSSTYSAATARGTSSDPYKTIDDAISNAVTSGFTTVKVKGTVSGAQTIGTVEDGITDITLVGTGTNPALNGGFTSASKGTTLTVNNSSLAVTIKDLTITGGYAATNGGGINITAGTVKLVNGAKVTGNIAANYGGGVYVAGSSSQLFMSGSSLIGDSATSTTLAMDGTNAGSTTFANKAANGAGIYNDGGAAYIGCDTSGVASTGYALVANSTDGYYGVRRNFTTTGGAGAGIYHAGGTLKIASGDISNNNAGAAQSGACNGGGIYFAADAIISGGTFTNNFAANGGGLYIASGKSVTINGNAVFTKNKSWVNGGAIYNYGELIMSAGTIGGNETTDVNSATGSAGLASYGGAIYQNGTFKMSGSACISSVGSGVKSNDVYLSGNKTITIASTTLTGGDTVATITPKSWTRGRQILGVSGVTVTESQLNTLKAKFALTESVWDKENIQESGVWTGVEINSPIYVAGASDRVICSAPASDANGTKVKPYATIAAALGASDLSTAGGKITIDGTLGAQEIDSDTPVATGVSSVTLQGYKASSTAASSAKIDANKAANTPCLKLGKTGLTLTIQDLLITGAAYNGISLNAGTLKLGDGAKISGNICSGTVAGGGLYVASGATLFMYGKSLIGDKLATDSGVAAPTSSSDCANYGYGGGGIFNEGTVYIGADGLDGSGNPNPKAMEAGYGIVRNMGGTNCGGGILNTGTVKILSGEISYNSSAGSGGAIHNYKYSDSASSVKISGAANMLCNKAANDGGAIYNDGDLIMSAGNIGASGQLNTAGGKGGAIYQKGYFHISGSAFIYPGSEKSNDVYVKDEKYVTLGSPALSGYTGTNQMTITPEIWQRGKIFLTGTGVATNLAYFKCSDSEWSVVQSGGFGAFDTGSTIYVSENAIPDVTGGVAGDDDTGRGTQKYPYATIQKAATETWQAQTYTISVNGTLTATKTTSTTGKGNLQNIPNSTDIKATSITLTGTNDATINGNTKGTAFSLNKNIPVTITNLKITGGKGTNGSGIYIGAGIVKLGTKAIVTGNYNTGNGSCGGGVYVDTSGTLFMYGSSLIGDQNVKTGIVASALGTDDDGNYKCANRAQNGGGIYNKGKVYIGYQGYKADGTTLDSKAMESGYGVVRNATAVGGGGGISNQGTLQIASGEVSYNYSGVTGGGIYCNGDTTISFGKVCGNVCENGGGGLYINSGKSVTIKGSATVSSNEVTGSNANGGGIYIGGSLTLSDSTFENNKVTGATGKGGAIYQNGSLSMSGGMSIKNGVEQTNDVYLPSNKKVTISGSISTSPAAYITPSSWPTGTSTVTVLEGSGVSSYYDRITTSKKGYYINSSGALKEGYLTTVSGLDVTIKNIAAGTASAKIVVKSGNITSYLSSVSSALSELFEKSSDTKVTLDLSATTFSDNTVPSSAFANCYNLDSVKLPSSITKIESSAFYWSGLTSISIPSNVTSIGANAFNSCTSCGTITIPADSKLTSIGDNAFNGTMITSINIPSSVTSIGSQAFKGTWLTSVTLPDNITTLGNGAFSQCNGLTSFTVPSTITQIPDQLLRGCKNITTITIKTKITKIGTYAFDCQKLNQINYKDNSQCVASQWPTIYFGQYWRGNGTSAYVIPEEVNVTLYGGTTKTLVELGTY